MITVLISRRLRRSLLDVKVRRGGDIESDHELAMIRVKLKLARIVKPLTNRRYAVERLRK